MKHRVAIVHGSHPKPGKVSEPLRALTSILSGLRSEEKGRSGFLPAYIHYPQGPLLHLDINRHTSPDRTGCPSRRLRHNERNWKLVLSVFPVVSVGVREVLDGGQRAAG